MSNKKQADNTCADCGMAIGTDKGPPDGWQLEDGRTVCQACCAEDLHDQAYEVHEVVDADEWPEKGDIDVDDCCETSDRCSYWTDLVRRDALPDETDQPATHDCRCAQPHQFGRICFLCGGNIGKLDSRQRGV